MKSNEYICPKCFAANNATAHILCEYCDPFSDENREPTQLHCNVCNTDYKTPVIRLIEISNENPEGVNVSVNEQIPSKKDDTIRDLESQLEGVNIYNNILRDQVADLNQQLHARKISDMQNAQNLNILAKSTGLDGMTYTHVVSEVVSRLEKLSRERYDANGQLASIKLTASYKECSELFTEIAKALKIEGRTWRGIAQMAISEIQRKFATTEAVHDLVKYDHIQKQNEHLKEESAKLAVEVITLRRENEKLEDRNKNIEESRDEWIKLLERLQAKLNRVREAVKSEFIA